MKLPAKPPTKVDRVRTALHQSGQCNLVLDAKGEVVVRWIGSLSALAVELFGPDPVLMPSTEAMAAHMDEFYADSFLDNAGIPSA